MDSQTIDKIIRDDLPSLRLHFARWPDGLEGAMDGPLPSSVNKLSNDIVEGARKLFDWGEYCMITWAEYLALIPQINKQRDTGGFFHIHPHFVAKAIASSEPYEVIIPAQLHDSVEESSLGLPERENILMIIQSLKAYALKKCEGTPETGVIRFGPEYAEKVAMDMAFSGAVLDKLTMRKKENYFKYLNRLFESPAKPDRRQKKFYKALGFDYKRPEAQAVVEKASLVKLIDRTHNTNTLSAVGEKYDKYPFQKQLYEIYKNILLISQIKMDKALYASVKETPYYNNLLEASLIQLAVIQKALEAKYPSLAKKKGYYAAAITLYEMVGGMNELTKHGDTEAPKGMTKYMERTYAQLDGTMSRYAGYVHKIIESPRKHRVSYRVQYANCLLFFRHVFKLNTEPEYAVPLQLNRRRTKHFIESTRLQ